MITIRTKPDTSPMTGQGYTATADNGDSGFAATWPQAAVIVAKRNAKLGDTVVVHGPDGQHVIMGARPCDAAIGITARRRETIPTEHLDPAYRDDFHNT